MKRTEQLARLLEEIDRRAAYIRERRPLTPGEVKELEDYYRIGTTYSSNALEGNGLTLTETKVLLEDGITAGGKPIRDCWEAIGHGRAYDYMLTLARQKGAVTGEMICRLHQLFYSGIDPDAAGKYRQDQVFITGTTYVPPAPEKVPALMAAFEGELEEKRGVLHPVELAAYAHRRLVDIHPFRDGNGRTARLLMNLLLLREGYCIVTIPPVLRQEYIDALRQAQRERAPSDDAFFRLIAECEIEAQRDYCRMFRIEIPKGFLS